MAVVGVRETKQESDRTTKHSDNEPTRDWTEFYPGLYFG